MYASPSPDENGVPVAQLNLELRQAQLELLSAHCAIHQLRLHYSTADLARHGQREVLRKSLNAADAILKFYASIEERIPNAATQELLPQSSAEPTDQQIVQGIQWISSYLLAQRNRYFGTAGLLDQKLRSAMALYFPPALIERVRIVELEGARVAEPEFLGQVRALGFDQLPDVTHMDSLTFLDVIAFNEKLTERALFHGLVHAVQIEVLGLDLYAELWVRGFLRTRAHFTVPLEVHAFSLASKFVRAEKFSVEDEVLRWAADRRY